MYYTYFIYNIINQKLYVGYTANPSKRWSRHKMTASDPTKKKQAIHLAINKYGIQNFIFKVIDTFNKKQKALDREVKWIASLKESGYVLYNRSAGGESGGSTKLYSNLNGNFGKKMKPHVKEALKKCRWKLTEAQVEEIRNLYKTGNYSQTVLAKQFNMSLTQIHCIVHYKSHNGGSKDSTPIRKAQMTVETARKIKNLYSTGKFLQKELAIKYNTTPNYISSIVCGRKWKNA